jgi:hypothetical protein
MPGQSSDANSGKDAASSATPALIVPLRLPKGAAAIQGIGEKFAASSMTGTGSLAVRIPASKRPIGLRATTFADRARIARRAFTVCTDQRARRDATTIPYEGGTGGRRDADAVSRQLSRRLGALNRWVCRSESKKVTLQSVGVTSVFIALLTYRDETQS